jgi:hypothetical protein
MALGEDSPSGGKLPLSANPVFAWIDRSEPMVASLFSGRI